MTRPAALLFCLLAATPAAAAEGRVFTTADGVAVPTPAPDALDCAGMRRVLDAIDASGYRRGAPRPEDAADMALLDYENRLSRAFYARCIQASAGEPAPLRAFEGAMEFGR